jgi:hypothetical protein
MCKWLYTIYIVIIERRRQMNYQVCGFDLKRYEAEQEESESKDSSEDSSSEEE